MWDSIKNIKGIESKFAYFDSIFSFDFEDINKNSLIKYAYWGIIDYKKSDLPLSTKWDISFVGSAHSIRPKIIHDLRKICEENNLTSNFFLYSPNYLVFLFYKLTNKNFKFLSVKDVSFKPISFEQTREIHNQSRIILDICDPNQTGFTSRVRDMLLLRKKLMTNNKYINKTDLFNFANVHFYEKDCVTLPLSFVQLEYIEPNDSIINKYTFDTFIDTIFEISN